MRLLIGGVGLLGLVVFSVQIVGVEQEDGNITGIVTVDEIPESVKLKVDSDQVVCGDEVEDMSMVVDSSGGVANAVILVKGADWIVDPPEPTLNNVRCYFEPRVQIVKTRSVVTVTSNDELLHTTHAYDDRARTLFNIAIPIPGMEIERPLRRPGLVRVECDSHSWMRGWVFVSDDLGVVSGSDGRFEISDVPPGTYELEIWHERYRGETQTVTVTSGGATIANFNVR